MKLGKQFINRHRPTRHRGFCLGDVAAFVYCRRFRIAESVDFDHLIAKQNYIPHNESTGGKIVTSFLDKTSFCNRPVVILASHLESKSRCAREKLISRIFPS